MAAISKETLALLSMGYVWRHLKSGRQSTVLFLANTELKGSAAERNPPMVVYLDDKGKRNAIPVDAYIAEREYITMDLYVERHLQLALRLIDEEIEVTPDEDQDTAPKSGPPEEDPQAGEPEPFDVEIEADSQLKAEFKALGEGNPIIDQITLASSILQYEQDPDVDMVNYARSRVRHKLVVALNGFTLDQLNSVFTPGTGYAYYPEFTINGISVNWSDYYGAYPVVSPDGLFASVIFTTPLNGSFEEQVDSSVEFDEEQDLTQQPAEETQPEPEVTEPAQEPKVAEQPEITVRVETKYERPEVEAGVLQALTQVATPLQQPAAEDDPVIKLVDDDETVVVAGQGNSPEDDQRQDTDALFGKPVVQPQGGMTQFQIQPTIIRK